MANIENIAGSEISSPLEIISSMGEPELMAQELVQQGAVHAISTLLRQGCQEQTALQMLEDLRMNCQLIREEFVRRGMTPNFEQDQLNFN